jgi:lambda family phage holin
MSSVIAKFMESVEPGRVMTRPMCNDDLLAAILAAKEQGIGAILAFAMAYLRGRYNGGAFTKTVIDATMCAIIAWFIRDLLDLAGLSSNLAYITSVFIGYIGTDSIGSLIKRFAAKKAGVEDGGNQ